VANRRFDMYQYRQILVRMRRGDSDRDIARFTRYDGMPQRMPDELRQDSERAVIGGAME
jgi:hypothetical protein